MLSNPQRIWPKAAPHHGTALILSWKYRVQRSRASPALTSVLGGRARRGRVDLFLWAEWLQLYLQCFKVCLTAADCADIKKKNKLRSEVASFVRLSRWWSWQWCSAVPTSSFMGKAPLHGTELKSAGSNSAAGDTQSQMCLLSLVKASVLRRDVAEGISSAPGTWNCQSLLLEQHQPRRDDIPGCSCSPYPLVSCHCMMTDSDQHHLHSPGWLEAQYNIYSMFVPQASEV